MKERFLNYSRILSQGEDARPMISGLVRNQGGTLPKVEPWILNDAPVSPTCQKQDHRVIQESDNEEAVNEGKGIITISV